MALWGLIKSNDSKTTVAGSILGAIVAFGQPVLDFLQGISVTDNFSWKNLVIGVIITVLGKMSAGTKKE